MGDKTRRINRLFIAPPQKYFPKRHSKLSK